MNYETVIGLEVHVELATNSKIFCSCSAHSYGADPNTHVCPACCGMPGMLPVVNKRVVDFENLCDCCGERPRGTKKNPDSIFCEECEAILEKYPYDWKGLVTIILVLGVLLILKVIKFS